MARAMRMYILLAAISAACLCDVPSAVARDCVRTCVDITREGGELVITARRDPVRKRVSSAPTPLSAPTPSRRPTIKRARAPRPSLSDQIRQGLPPHSFTILPYQGALIWEPVIVRASGCTPLRKTIPILDTSILLDLHPSIEWSWGDGQSERWRGSTERFAHIYKRAGRYHLQMHCQWGGSFRTPDGPWRDIPSGIGSTFQSSIELFRAQIFFTE